MGTYLLLYLICQLSALRAASFDAHLPGMWYPKEPKKLKNALASHYRAAAEKKTKNPEKDQVVVLIAPHAGYRYSGAVAATGYRLLDAEQIKRIIILAPSHQVGFEGVALPFFSAYTTPLGSLKVDADCIKKLSENKLFTVRTDVWRTEHSLEMQLPFIQYAFGDTVPIVPLIIGTASLQQLNRLATTLKKCIDAHTLVIVSSDFTHHGTRFGYAPFAQESNVQQRIKKLDRTVIDTIMHKNLPAVDRILKQTQATVCGRMPIKLFKALQAAHTWPPLHAKLVDYNTSYAVTGDPVDSVSYATIIFYTKGAK